MGIKLFDNYEDDGQLSMFGAEEQAEEAPERQTEAEGGTDVRIRSCSCCGKLLYVREEKDTFISECNNCGVRYSQKK